MQYKLGRGIVQLGVPIVRIPIQEPKPTKQKEDSIITNKILIVMAIVAIVKIAVFLLWPI